MELLHFLKKFDKFGYRPQLLYKKRSTYKTSLGGVFSILLFGGIIYTIILCLIFIVSSKNRTVIHNKQPYAFDIFNSIDTNIETRSNLNLDNFYKNDTNSSFMMIFRLVDAENNKNNYEEEETSSLDSKFQLNATFEMTNKLTQLTKIVNLPLANCKLEYFSKFYCIDSYLFTNVSYYSQLNLKIINLNYTSQGSLTGEYVKNQNYNFYRKLNSYLQVYFPIKMVNTFTFDFEKNSQDFKYYFKELIIPLNSDDSINLKSLFSPISYQIDRGNIFKKYEDFEIDYNYEYLSDDIPYFDSKKIRENNPHSNKTLSQIIKNKTLIELKVGLSDHYILYNITGEEKFMNIFTKVTCLFFVAFNLLSYFIRKINKKIFFNELISSSEDKKIDLSKISDSMQYIEKFSNSIKSLKNSEEPNNKTIVKLGKSPKSPLKNNSNRSMSNTVIYSNLKEVRDIKEKNSSPRPQNLKEINLNLREINLPELSLDYPSKISNMNDSNMNLNLNSFKFIDDHKFEDPKDHSKNLITDLATAIKIQENSVIQKTGNVKKNNEQNFLGNFNAPNSLDYKNSNKNIKFSFGKQSSSGNSGINFKNSNENKIIENNQLNFQDNSQPSLSPKINSADSKNHGIFIYKVKNTNIIKNNLMNQNALNVVKPNFTLTTLICNFYISIKNLFRRVNICSNKYSVDSLTQERVLSVISIETLVNKLYLYDKFFKNFFEVSKRDKE
jgi:hypothetical protein